MTTDDPDLAALVAVNRHFTSIVESVADGQWGLPTPCTDWDVSALVDHVTGGNWFTCAILDGRTAEDAMANTLARFSDGRAGADQAVSSIEQQHAAFTRPGALDQTWSHVAGKLPGRRILRLRLHDLIVHTWDLQQAITGTASVPPRLTDWGLDELADPESLAATRFGSAEAPAEAAQQSPTAAYLAVFGRSL